MVFLCVNVNFFFFQAEDGIRDLVRSRELGDVYEGQGDRTERIRTYHFPQGRMTDHRIGLTLYRLDQILQGNLDEIIDALTAEAQAAMLADMNG